MKIKVKQDFRDRSADLALRKKGEVLDVSEQRAKELTAKGFAAEVKPKQEEKEDTTEQTKWSAARSLNRRRAITKIRRKRTEE